VEKVTLEASDFLDHGAELFRHGPVRGVRLRNLGDRLGDLAECKHLARITELDLRHEPGLTPQTIGILLESRYLSKLRTLVLRGTAVCNGPGIRAIAASSRLTALTTLDLGDHCRDPRRGTPGFRPSRDYQAYQRWRRETEGNIVDETSMRALVE